ncbi:hypothetical protein BDR22DRAFT_803521, partial [Usnea florida]
HIADLDCICLRGYSGHQISLAEMKGCRAVQYLVRKDVDWQPESDDEAFVIDGTSFLSGISDGPTPRTPLENSYPVRRGIPGISIDYYGFPFHPTCFEMYRKVSRARTGEVDTEGLFSPWYNREDIFGDRIVMNASESEVCWRHEPGRESFVADPIKVPGLQKLLEPPESPASKRVSFGSSDRLDDSQVEDLPTPSSIRTVTQDIFTVLPAEITTIILDCLGSKDIANLRLATPVYRQLPTALFRRLFWEEMPWLFEVNELDMARVDWSNLYCRCKIGWRHLKGLRNRERIWRAVEEIMNITQRYREKGNISEL